MTPEQLQGLLTPLLERGLLGIACVFLGYLAWFFYRTRETERREHKIETAALNKRIEELHEKRLLEKDAITNLALSHNRTIDELSRTLATRLPA